MARVRAGRMVVALFGVLVLAARASAQDGGITGVVKDTSGGVLPGTTVTAASPALIEQQRVAVTDAEPLHEPAHVGGVRVRVIVMDEGCVTVAVVAMVHDRASVTVSV